MIVMSPKNREEMLYDMVKELKESVGCLQESVQNIELKLAERTGSEKFILATVGAVFGIIGTFPKSMLAFIFTAPKP